MMTPWTGKIYLCRHEHGYDHISLTTPTEPVKTLRAFQVTGPFIPIGLQKYVVLDDPGKWLGDLLLSGFTLRECTVD